MTEEKLLIKDEQARYLNDLKKYKDMGVKITIDGKTIPEKEWKKIFRVDDKPVRRNQKSFYMADYIEEPCGKVSEIRLEKIIVKCL